MSFQPMSQSSEALSQPETILIEADLIEAEMPQSVQARLQIPVSPAEPACSERTGLKVFLSTFLTIFLAELGDKTQVTTLLLAAKSHAPWIVFAGAGTALVATSFLGVWLGCWLAQRISARTLETAAGILLLFISAQLFWEVFQL